MLLVARDFNIGKLKSVLPNFYQHVTCATRGKKTLDLLFSTHRDVYKALPCPPFGKTDHNSILQIPAYKKKLKQEEPVTRSIRKWLDGADATLQDCFASTAWNMFWDSSNGIEEYTTYVTDFISKSIDDLPTTVTVRAYPNQKSTSALGARLELQLSRSVTLIRTPIRNPAMPSDTEECTRAPRVLDDCKITLSVVDVSKIF